MRPKDEPVVRSIAPPTDTNNGTLGHAARSTRNGNSRADFDCLLDTQFERFAAIASQVADQVADLLVDDFLATLEQAAGNEPTAADLARAIARASARSARLTVYVVANPADRSLGSAIAAGVRRVLRRPLPNECGADLGCAETPPEGTTP